MCAQSNYAEREEVCLCMEGTHSGMNQGPEGRSTSLWNSYTGALEFRRQVAGDKKLLEAELASLGEEPNAVGAL